MEEQTRVARGLRRPTPPAVSEMLSAMPPVGDFDRFYFEAFNVLGTCRRSVDRVCRIPWNDIRAFGLSKGLEGDVLAGFEHVIMAMDVEWCAVMKEQEPKAPPASPPGPSPRSPRARRPPVRSRR